MITDKNSEFKILVVDDDPDLLRIIECLLNEQNYIVSTAVSGQECLQAIQLDKPDLILLDVKLPDIGGIDICKTIKSDPELSSIYIVLLSGIKKQSDNISEGLEKGADDYLTKPLKNREFLARIGATFRTIRAEKMLRESESKYRLLTDNMTDAVWLMDMNLKFVYISPSVEKTRGYTLAELRQLSLDQILTPASFQTVMETFSIEIPKILADPSYSPVQVFDLEFYMRDGSIHSLETILSVIRDENGNPINILGQDREITKRKRAEQALQERLKELNCLYSISALMELPDISIDEILNKTLMMLSLSMQFPEITEVRIVLEGKTYQSAHFRETSRMLAREIKVCGKPVGQLEVCYLEDRPSDFRPEPQFMIEEKHLFNAIAGRLGHMIEHKKANIELINAFVRNEALLDAIPDMIFILDSKGVIVDFHTQNHEDLYVQPETLLGKNVADVLPGEMADLFLEKVAAVFTTAQSCQSTYMLEMNGSPKHYESRYVPCGNGQVLAIVRDITDRKQMEQELRKSEERFRHISSTISDISYSCVSNQDSSYSIDWMTGAVEQITGYSIDEIKAMKCWGKLVIDEDLDCFKHHVTGLSHDSTGNCELRLRHKNGAILWVASFAQCIKNQVQPEDIKLYGALVDITTRKQAEAMLHESEEKFRLAFETSPDSIAIIRIADGVIVSVNKGFLQMSGYTHEEVIGKTNSEINNWKDPEERRKFVEEMQSRGEVRNYEAPLLTNSGEIYGLMSGFIIDLHGEPHILTITRDITERKLTELERQIFYEISLSVSTTKNLNEFLKVIHQSLRKRLYADNCFISLYDQNTDLFSFPYFVDKFDPTPLRAKMRKSVTRHVFRTGEPLLMTPEIFQQLKEQNEVELMGMPASSWIGVPIQAPDRIIGVLVLQHYEENNVYSEKDIKFLTTVGSQIAIVIERKQAEEEIKHKIEQLQKTNAEKDKFFSIIAHDLRGPFNGLLGLTRLLTEELPTMTQDQIKKCAVTMRKSATKLYSLLENLLEWSMLQRGLISFKPESFILLNGIAPIIELYRDAADKKMIRLDYEVPEDLRVLADKRMFDSLMRNLVFNAVKFTPKGGKINITAKPRSDFLVEISIKDTGIGMNKHTMDTLFLLDEQDTRKGTEGEPSTGLGLIISRDFIEKHGGKIWVESEEGKGSTFYFTIPYNAEAQGRSDTTDASSQILAEYYLENLTILIAEDEETSELLITSMLKKISHKVIHTRTGAETVEACRNNPDIELVLMDIRMPGMNGYEATRQIRQFNTDVVIIAQTAYGLQGDREKAIKAGCNDYISKPIDKDELFGLIQKYFRK